MKSLLLSINEEETLKDLLDEEIEETKKCQVSEEKMLFLTNLKNIRKKLEDNGISIETRLGFEIGLLKDTYKFKDIYKFLTGQTKECFYFIDIKPLYDKFGYQAVNEVIIAVGKEMIEEQKDE